MDLLLDQSTLIQSFLPDEQEDARQLCRDKFHDAYIAYLQTDEPDEGIVDSMIDMYLYLGATPPQELINRIKHFLLKGKVFDKLDIYTHLPEYDQIVKLLRPEYIAKVDNSCFRIFTINEVIYNTAIKTYLIKDDYRNAYSVWYMDRLRDKGIKATRFHLHYYLEKGPWECANKLLKVYRWNDKILESCVRGGMPEAIDYLLNDLRLNVVHIINVAIKQGNIKVLKTLGTGYVVSTVSILRSMQFRNYETVLYVLRNYNFNKPHDVLDIAMEMGWVECVELMLPRFPMNPTLQPWNANTKNLKILSMLYDKSLEAGGDVGLTLEYALQSGHYDIFKRIYKNNPIPITFISAVLSCSDISMIRYCLTLNINLSVDNIVRAIRIRTLDVVKEIFNVYPADNAEYIREAVDNDDINMVIYLRSINCPWDKTCLKACRSKSMYQWLVSNGCPT